MPAVKLAAAVSAVIEVMLAAVSTVMERLGLVGDDGAAETLV